MNLFYFIVSLFFFVCVCVFSPSSLLLGLSQLCVINTARYWYDYRIEREISRYTGLKNWRGWHIEHTSFSQYTMNKFYFIFLIIQIIFIKIHYKPRLDLYYVCHF